MKPRKMVIWWMVYCCLLYIIVVLILILIIIDMIINIAIVNICVHCASKLCLAIQLLPGLGGNV